MLDQIQKWPNHLVLVRHGESERNIHKEIAEAQGELVYGGDIRDVDVPLTGRGRAQAVATGKALSKTFQFDRMFVSPYVRTHQTAAIMSQQFANPIPQTVEERIREIEFGTLDGLTKAGTQARYPSEWERKQRLGKYWYRPPGGESYPDVALRVHSFLGTITREYSQQSVLVICHSVIVPLFRKLMERLSDAELLAIDCDRAQDVWNCSVSHYEFDPSMQAGSKLVARCHSKVYYDAEIASEECQKYAIIA
jgi:broad specificity phosphatase PhoE